MTKNSLPVSRYTPLLCSSGLFAFGVCRTLLDIDMEYPWLIMNTETLVFKGKTSPKVFVHTSCYSF